MCFSLQLVLGIILQFHQFTDILPCRKDLLGQLIHLLIQTLIACFFLSQRRVLLEVLIGEQLEVFLHSLQFILQQDYFALGLCCSRCSGVVGGDHIIQLILQLLLEFDQSYELLLDYVVGLFHLRQSHPMFLPLLLLIQCLTLALCKCSPQSLLLPFFLLPLHSQCFQFILKLLLFILQLGDFSPQFLNNQLIAVPSLNQTLQLVLLLHQFLISQLNSQTSVLIIVADTAINPFQCLQLIFQALGLILDDLIVVFDAFSLDQGALYVYLQPLNLLVIEVLWNQIISGSFDLAGFILKLLDPLTQLQVILLLFLQHPQLLLQLPHRFVLVMTPHRLSIPFCTHFDYSSNMNSWL